MAEWTKATVLKTVVLRTPVNEWLDPMKEAPSFKGAFLVSETPPIGKPPGWGTSRVGGSAAGASRYTGSPFHDGGGPVMFGSGGSWTFIGSLGKVISTSTGQIGFRGC